MSEDQVATYTACPLQVRAIRWTGANFEAVENFVGAGRKAAYDPERRRLYVWTRDGATCVVIGDWLVMDRRHDLHAMGNLKFQETYAAAEVDHHPV